MRRNDPQSPDPFPRIQRSAGASPQIFSKPQVWNGWGTLPLCLATRNLPLCASCGWRSAGMEARPGAPAAIMVMHAFVPASSSAKGVAQEDREGPRPVPTLTPCPSKGPSHPQSPCNLLSLTRFVRADGAAQNPRQPLQARSCPTALSFLPREGDPGVKAMLRSFPRHPRCREPGTRGIGPRRKRVRLCKTAGLGARAGLGSNLLCDLGEASSLSGPHCCLL